MADLKKRVSNLENLVNSLIKMLNLEKAYDKAEMNADKIGISNNTSGVADNDMAICDIADLADTNSSAIDDLAIIVDELSNKILEMEG